MPLKSFLYRFHSNSNTKIQISTLFHLHNSSSLFTGFLILQSVAFLFDILDWLQKVLPKPQIRNDIFVHEHFQLPTKIKSPNSPFQHLLCPIYIFQPFLPLYHCSDLTLQFQQIIHFHDLRHLYVSRLLIMLLPYLGGHLLKSHSSLYTQLVGTNCSLFSS